MAMEVGACDRMIATAQRAGVQLFVAHTERFIPATRAAKDILDSGRVGTPVMATDVWYQPFRRETRQPWMLDRARGGGFLQMAGSHMIDRLVYLLGSPVRSVRASVRTPTTRTCAATTPCWPSWSCRTGSPAPWARSATGTRRTPGSRRTGWSSCAPTGW